jgi:Microcystin-dependent protein
MEKDFSKHTVYGNFCSMDNRAFPIDCETLAALQSNAKKMAASALIAGCSRLILTGCKESGSKRAEGYVFIVNADNPLTGEVIYHPEQTKADYCYIKEDPVLVEADGKKYREAYDIRYIVDGRIDGAWAWSSFTNITDISNAALKEGLTGVKNDLNTKDSVLRTLITQKETTLNNTINTKESALNTLIEQKTTSSSVAFVRGMIMMWSGSVPPSGWALCDGSNGTPNLVGRFILGGTSKGPYSDNTTTNGKLTSDNQTLSVANLPTHNHNISIDWGGKHTHSYYDTQYTFGEGKSKGSDAKKLRDAAANEKFRSTFSDGYHGHSASCSYTGSGSAFNVTTQVPYYTLAFIMKL